MYLIGISLIEMRSSWAIVGGIRSMPVSSFVLNFGMEISNLLAGRDIISAPMTKPTPSTDVPTLLGAPTTKSMSGQQ